MLDFGAWRDFDKEFTDWYLKVVDAAARKDKDGVIFASRKLKFLTGEESPLMNDAHASAVMIIGTTYPLLY